MLKIINQMKLEKAIKLKFKGKNLKYSHKI